MVTKQELEQQLAEAQATIEKLTAVIDDLKEGIIRSNEQITECKEQCASLTEEGKRLDKENKRLRADYDHADANWAAALQENHRLKVKVERLQGRSLWHRILNR